MEFNVTYSEKNKWQKKLQCNQYHERESHYKNFHSEIPLDRIISTFIGQILFNLLQSNKNLSHFEISKLSPNLIVIV